MEQLEEVYRSTSLVDEAIARARLDGQDPAEDMNRRIAGVRHELRGARRALDRYFAAFEEGSLSPTDCQERIASVKARIDSLVAEEASLARQTEEPASEAASALEVAEWAKGLRTLLARGSAQQRKALLRLLIKELRVMSRGEILPTYRVPALVRTPDRQVVPTGFEPVSPP